MDIQLKVGQTVRRRDGSVDRIVAHNADHVGSGVEFSAETGRTYWANGKWSMGTEYASDIVEIISEPDCVTKELRELAAHVTKEFAELHARVAKLEGRLIGDDDPTDNAIPVLDINGEVIRGGDICELVLSKCRMVAKFDIDGDHWFESVVAKERMSADDFPAHIVNGEQRYKAVKRIGISPEWDGQPGSHGDPFAVDWSAAPGWATWHAVDADGEGWFYENMPCIPPAEDTMWVERDTEGDVGRNDSFMAISDGWRNSLRRRPEPEFKRGDRVMVRDGEDEEWKRRYFLGTLRGSRSYRATTSGPWAADAQDGPGWSFCRHPTPDELEGY